MKRINDYLNANLLYKNSIYLIMSNGVLSVGGFIFWIFVARLFPTYEIGIATSLIAIIGLISSIALLGFNTGIMRFLPSTENKNSMINSIISSVTITSFVLGILVLINIERISPPLGFIRQSTSFFIFFVVFAILTSLNSLLEAILTTFRSAKYVLIKNILQATAKIFLPFLLIGAGGFGIFSSYYGGGVIGLITGGFLLCRNHNIKLKLLIIPNEIKKIAIISVGTYIPGLMTTATQYILPILITNTLGPEQTAFYYIVVTTTNVLNLIPNVIAQNMIVEGSYNISKIRLHLKKALQLTFAILVPSVAIILLFGNYILLVFGKQYSLEGLILLKLLSICSLLVGVNVILSSLMITFNKMKILIFTNGVYSLTLFGASYYFIKSGIAGIGYAAILSQILSITLYIFAIVKLKKFTAVG